MRRNVAAGVGVAMLLLAPIGSGSAAANTWAGTWNSTFGPLILTAGGSGTYYEGKGTVSGTVKGNVLEGKWAQPGRTGKFKWTMSPDGRSFAGVWNYEGESAMTAGWSGTCAAGPCLKNRTGGGDGCQSSREPAARGALNEVTVLSCREGVEWRPSPRAEWQDVKKNQVLKQGDEISTDPDGSVVLQFADNSTVTVRSGTQIKIAAFFTEGGVIRTELLLKMGEVSAQVNKSETARSDFTIKAPSVGGTRGTTFSVFRDPAGKAEVWSVRDGAVEIAPTGGRPKLMIQTGQEVEITPRTVSRIAPIGKAGAVAGLNRQKAIALVLKAVGRSDDRCALTLPRTNAYAAKSAAKAWLVSVKVVGKVKGTAKWLAAKSKATPQNALAKKIAAGCR